MALFRLRSLFYITAMIALTLCHSGCQKNRYSRPKNTIVINYGSSQLQLHPHKVSLQSEITLIRNVGEGLMRLSKQSIPEPALAQSIVLSGQGPTWRVRLRKDLFWSDGSPITVDDFIVGWKAALSRQVSAPLVSLLFVIKNGEKLHQGKCSAEDLGVKKISDCCMDITLENPVSYFFHLLTSPVFFPIQAKPSSQNEREMASCGPFKVVQHIPGKTLVMDRNKHYWDQSIASSFEDKMAAPSELQKTPIEEIKFLFEKSSRAQLEMLDSGKIDLCGSPYMSVHASDLWDYPFAHDYNSRNVPELSTLMLVLNTQHPILKNRKIRKAISLSLMRERWVQQGFFSGEPCQALVPKALYSSYKKSEIREDLLLARKLLNRGIKELGISLKELVFDLTYSETHSSPLSSSNGVGARSLYEVSIHEKRAHIIKERLFNALGIQIQLKPLPREQCRKAQTEGNFSISTLYWTADYPHPLAFLDLFSATYDAYNFSKWSNAFYNELLAEAKETLALRTQERLMRKAERILLHEYPIIPISHPGSPCFYNPSLAGIVFHPDGCIDLRWAYTCD